MPEPKPIARRRSTRIGTAEFARLSRSFRRGRGRLPYDRPPMSDASPISSPRFVPRFLRWLAIAVACALPLGIATFRELGAAARGAEAAGIVVWAVVVARCEGRLGAGRSAAWRRSLVVGFAVWAAVQGAVACIAFGEQGVVRIFALSLYSLALVPFFLVVLLAQLALQLVTTVVGPIGMLPFEVVEFVEFVAVFLLTLLCGLPNLLAGLFATNLIELLRVPRASRPRQRSGTTGIERST